MSENIYDTIKSSISSHRDRSLVTIIVYCGPKVKELQALKAQNLSADKTSITVHFPTRSVKIENLGARFCISNWADTVNEQKFGSPLFSSTLKNGILTGKAMSAVYMNKILRQVFPDKNIRDFRRAFISKVIEENDCKQTIKDQIGISSDSALLHYTSN